MKKAKKLLVTLLVLTFVLSTFSVGFAANEEKLPTEVVRAQALGILKGDAQGNLNLDKPITRAEALALIIRISGLEKSADLMKGQTRFADVNPDPGLQWATGYINLGVGQGIVNGYPDGSFKGNAQVTYAEMAKMILYAMNYGVTVEGAQWPAGVMGKADDLDIFDKVNALPNVPALRGDVVKMIDNSLTINHLVQTGYGDLKQYEEGDKTFLSKMNVEELKKVVVTEIAKVNSKLDDDEIKLDDEVYTLKADVSADAIFGLEVDAWVNDDDEVFFVKVKTAEKDILVDTLDEYEDGVEAYAKDAKEVNLIAADDSYDLDEDVVIYVNHAKAKASDLKLGQYGKFVLEKGSVVFIDVVSAKAGFDGIIVKEVIEKDETIEYMYDSDEAIELDLTDADEYYIYLDGKEIELSDIEVDDVLYVAEVDDEYFITVVRNKVEGKLEKAKNTSATVDGKTYDKGLVATSSQDNDDTVNAYSADAVKDLVGEEVEVILDLNGQIRHIRGDEEETSDDIYGIAIKGQDYYDTIRIYVNGESKTYDVKRGTNDVSNSTNLAGFNGKIVKFTLNKDGEINSIADVTPGSVSTFKFDKDNDAIVDSRVIMF